MSGLNSLSANHTSFITIGNGYNYVKLHVYNYYDNIGIDQIFIEGYQRLHSKKTDIILFLGAQGMARTIRH